jgi:hypothetical protein
MLYDVTREAINVGRAYSDPTVRSIKLISENDEARFFRLLEKFRFADGGAFDFRGSDLRSADGRGGKLANSNERAAKGFKPTYEPTRSFKVARLKLDWIFVKPPGLKKPEDQNASYLFAPHYGRTLQALNYSLGERISDHNPMIVDLPLSVVGEPVRPNRISFLLFFHAKPDYRGDTINQFASRAKEVTIYTDSAGQR